MKRFIFWLNRKKRIREKRCGQCCLTCAFYKECRRDGYSNDNDDRQVIENY